MKETYYPPATAEYVSDVSVDMQRSLRKRFAHRLKHPIGKEVNGRWQFNELDLIALTSYSMNIGTMGGFSDLTSDPAIMFSGQLRAALEADPDADAVTITVGWIGDRSAEPGAVPFDPKRKTRINKPIHYQMVVNVSGLREYVRKHLSGEPEPDTAN